MTLADYAPRYRETWIVPYYYQTSPMPKSYESIIDELNAATLSPKIPESGSGMRSPVGGYLPISASTMEQTQEATPIKYRADKALPGIASQMYSTYSPKPYASLMELNSPYKKTTTRGRRLVKGTR